MSVPQAKSMMICAPPREVVELTSATAVLCAARSMGWVTCCTICAAGRLPVLIVMRTRGKAVCG